MCSQIYPLPHSQKREKNKLLPNFNPMETKLIANKQLGELIGQN